MILEAITVITALYIIYYVATLIMGRMMLKSYAERYINLYLNFREDMKEPNQMLASRTDTSLEDEDIFSEDFDPFYDDPGMQISMDYTLQKQAIEHDLMLKLKCPSKVVNVIALINIEIQNIVKSNPSFDIDRLEVMSLYVEPSLRITRLSQELAY